MSSGEKKTLNVLQGKYTGIDGLALAKLRVCFAALATPSTWRDGFKVSNSFLWDPGRDGQICNI
jgi:hypothetical protein